MEFEDMKLIWDSQNNEPLFAINQEALHARIQRKSHSINRSLDLVDWIMIGVNLVVGLVLIVDQWQDQGQAFEFVMPFVYLAFFVYAIYRRFARRQEIRGFENSVLGELEKALWQSDYLIKQSSSMVFWYLVPVLLLANVTMILNGKPLWALFVTIVVVPLAYFGGRWEVNKWHLPKKRELEGLREMLLKAEEQSA